MRIELQAPSSLEFIYPHPTPRRDLPAEIPAPFSQDFLEAAAVLPYSPRASAALSRRLLQAILHDVHGIKGKSLALEIDAFIARPGVPSHLVDALHAVRNVGNFAAHPLKDAASGQVLEVEPGEAAWLLETLESLLDFSFVQPRRLATRRAELDVKLKAAGKPPLTP